jgi:hypothetical protein
MTVEPENLLLTVRVGNEWKKIDISDEPTRDRWTIRMFRNEENGDMLTLGRL